jgi:hypothetical protein
MHRALRELRQLRKDRREMGEVPPCPYLVGVDDDDVDDVETEDVVAEATTPRPAGRDVERRGGVVSSVTTSPEDARRQMMSRNVASSANVQNEPISAEARASAGGEGACDEGAARMTPVFVRPTLVREASETREGKA